MRCLGAGVGLSIAHSARASLGGPAPEAPLRRADLPWLAAVIIFGGELEPLSLMQGLSLTSAASGSLLLNLEGIATMAIAWILFRENVNRWLVFGAFAIVLGGGDPVVKRAELVFRLGAAFIVAACLCWGVDTNLTRKLSSADPVQIAMARGLAAGVVNWPSA